MVRTPRSRGTVRAALIAVLFASTAGAGAAAEAPPLRGFMQNFVIADQPEAVPELAWRDAEGGTVGLADFRGRVVLLNFWATWCAPCVLEMPALDRLQAARGGPDFQVVALSQDFGGMHQIEPFYQEAGLTRLAMYHDPKGVVRRALAVTVMPTTILFDRQGRELGRLEGVAEWDAPESVELMQWAIGLGPGE